MQIFLSYASEDRLLADHIQLVLIGGGHQVFFDQQSLPPGGDYQARIRDAVKGSDFFIFLISPESIAQGSFALTELKYAREKWAHPKDHVLPVVVRTVPWETIPAYLTAVTVLQPRGNVPAEVFSAVVATAGRDSVRGAVDSARKERVQGLEVGGIDYVGLEFMHDNKTNTLNEVVSVHVRNKRADKSYDDVRVELRLPAYVGFVHEHGIHSQKLVFGHATILLMTPVHPGDAVRVGYVKKHFDLSNPLAGAFGATKAQDVLEWTATARDEPAVTGELDVSRLAGK